MIYNPQNIAKIHKEYGEMSKVTVTYSNGQERSTLAFQTWVDDLIQISGKKFRYILEKDQSRSWVAEDVEEE